MTRPPTNLKRSRPICQLRKNNTSKWHRYPSYKSRETYLGSARSNEVPLSRPNIFQRRLLKLRTINQAHIHKLNESMRAQRNPRFKFRRSDAVGIYLRRKPTTTKPTYVALPSLTSHSTFYNYSRSILCKPQDSPHSPLTRVGVIISYSLHLERKITSPLTSIISPYIYSEPSDETIWHLYGVPSK